MSSKGAKTVFEALATSGGDPRELIESLGVAQITDEATIQGFINDFIAAHPEQLDQYKGGNKRLFGFFVGGVLKASGGRAAPDKVNRLLGSALNAE